MRSLKSKIGVTVRNTDNFDNELTLIASLVVLDTMQIHKYQTEKLTPEKQRILTNDVKDRLMQSLFRYDEIQKLKEDAYKQGYDGGANRTFIFQVCQDYAHCYADDLMPNKTDHYLYIGEITDCIEKPHILYECDGMACKDCFHKECHETTDITHAKNFKYYNGKWVERRDYSPRNLYC